MNIYFIGYRGTGKTTVAKLVAQQLQREWIDADVELQDRAKKTIAEIFSEEGEDKFRQLESEVVKDLAREKNSVVALGGGAILRCENRERINASGKTVWLTASPEVLYSRIYSDEASAAQRPDLTNQGGLEEIRSVLEKRLPLYQQCADVTVSTESGSPESIANEVVRWFTSDLK